MEKISTTENKDMDIQMEFLNIVSHELKTPLTPMIAYLNLLSKGKLGDLTTQQKDALEKIMRNAKLLRRLIWDLLDLSRMETGNMKFNMQEIDLIEIIKEVTKDMRTFAQEKNIIIDSELIHLPKTEGDNERISQVITNLLDNAIKFTPENGEVMVRTKRKGYDLIISISDTGIGISKTHLERIFNKFMQVDSGVTRKYSGTGLGLTICKGIIKAHGGSITVESEPNKGSTFTIKLPYKSLGKPTEMFMEVFKKK